MATYLIKWNKDEWPWKTLRRDVENVRRKGFHDDRWSCANNKRIKVGDRFFLMKSGKLPRGIIGSGTVIAEPEEGDNFSENRRKSTTLYIGVRFDTLLNSDEESILEIDQLKTKNLSDFFRWPIRKSGITIAPPAAAELEIAWKVFLTDKGYKPISFADEVLTPARYFEGSVQKISVNTYERNPFARQLCIEHYGSRCSVCGFDFEKVFGVLGNGFIHVHHLKPLMDIQKEYEIDPVKDLRPVCPNCHAMIHRDSETLSIESLKRLIKKQK